MSSAKTPKTTSIVYRSVVFILFVLAGFNLFALRGIYLLGAFVLSLLHLFLIKGIRIRPLFFFVVAFTVSLAIIYCSFTAFSFVQLMMIGFLPVFAFIIGQNASDHKVVSRDMIAISLGYASTVLVNFFVSLSKGAVVDGNGIGFYYDLQLQAESPRTFVSIDFIPCVALGVALLCLTNKKRWFTTIPLGLILIGGPLVLNGFVGNRSLVLIVPVLLMVLLSYCGIKASSIKKRVIAWSFSAVLMAGALFLYFGFSNNLFSMRNLADAIPAIGRFIDKTGSGREEQYQTFFKEWANYPSGGMFVTNLFADYYGTINQIHNTFLQVYSIGGWLPFIIEAILLVFWFYMVFAVKITKRNRFGVILSVSLSIGFFAISLFEPMITSEPFICSLFFLCAGYLYGEWTGQKNRRPLLTIGLSQNSGPSPSSFELAAKAFVLILLISGLTALIVLSGNGGVFSVLVLLTLALAFALIDKADYSALSVVKTIICLMLACGFAITLNLYLPTNTWMYSLAKSGLSIALFIFLRIVLVQKSEEKDGYYRLRNFFTKLARDIDGSPEENLVSQDLQTNNEGE